MRAFFALLVFLSWCPVAGADGHLADDPDVEVARRYYDQGAQLYADGKYQEAIALFEKARAVKAAPGLDYNIARAWDRLGNVDRALAGYRRYLDSQPADTGEVRARVTLLEARVQPAIVAAAPSEPPKKKRRTALYAVLGVAAVVVVGVAVGLGVGLGAQPANPSAPLGALKW
jgi:tetratricopeptide (TPR) repeat protein